MRLRIAHTHTDIVVGLGLFRVRLSTLAFGSHVLTTGIL